MPPPHRYMNNNFTYVSSCTKYLIFLLNFLFWLLGGLLIGIGLYSGLDKFQATGLIKLDTYYDIILNISIVMVLSGAIVFIVSFCGCLGALRENTCLLKFYSLCLLIFFLCEMAVAIIAFIFPHTMNTVLEDSFTERVSIFSLTFTQNIFTFFMFL
jgi:tetraspanin-33